MAGLTPAPENGAPVNFRATPDKYAAIDDLLTSDNAINKPEVRDMLVKTYGDQGITGFLKLTGAITSAGQADQVEYYEEGRRHRVVVLAGNTSGTGVDMEFSVSAESSDTAGDDPATSKFFQTRDVLMNSVTGVRYIVKDDQRSSDKDEILLARLDGAVFSSADNISGNTEFVLLGNLYAQGSDQPQLFNTPEVVKRKNPFMIVKDRFQVNGSQATNLGYINVGNGDYRWFMHGEKEARKRFEDRREMMMLFSELNDGGAASGIGVSGSEGYFSAVDARGIKVTGANANPLDSFAEFDDIIIELDKQGAPSEYAMYLNRKQDLSVDDMLASGIATQVTAGLSGQFGAFNNDADMAVKLGFKSFTRGGYTFHKHDWKLLNDPTLVGASNKFQGAMLPMSQVADARTGIKSPALEMCYKSSNGYSREMEHWVTGGGIMGHVNGDSGKDVMTFHYRSELNLITRAANQHVVLQG